MYSAVLILHSLWRWVVLGLAFWLLIALVRGAMQPTREFSRVKRLMSWFVISLDIQLLLGLLLFVALSPTTTRLLLEGKMALGDPHVVYWTMEHVVPMTVAVLLAHAGQVSVRRASGAAQYRRALFVFGVVFVVILISIPWPFRVHGRPWVRI